MKGFVSLVGAGPGHPDHLTVRAVRRLRDADVVLHDALVSPDVLALAAGAHLVDVGKRRGHAPVPQAEIVRQLIAAARVGCRVVRLKGGDPFVFGRGGEEAAALIDAGIPFEVVPGITTAVAAPALAGIPVTHRGCARGFVVVTGSPVDGLDDTLGSISPHGLTLVILMATRVRAAVSAALVRNGWSLTTPCALVVAASDRGWTWRGTLAGLSAVEPPPTHADRPGTIVVGEVVGLPIVLADGEWIGGVCGVDAAPALEGAAHAGAR
jgi:uroporphyrin-III C-methyltransferase/precorrin-2 dehydrogenase/sirohydrochlorin ferrochelatase